MAFDIILRNPGTTFNIVFGEAPPPPAQYSEKKLNKLINGKLNEGLN